VTRGDRARVTRGPWVGFEGTVTATFAGGWVAIVLDGMERTFAATDLEVIA
jgi:hypothetical protein